MENNTSEKLPVSNKSSSDKEYSHLMKDELMKGIYDRIEKKDEVFTRALKVFMKDKD